MAKEINLPKMGQTMEEGTVVNCLVKVGDEVKKGQVIFEIETDKATLEMESPVNGFVKYVLVQNNQTLPVGAPLMVLGEQNEQVPMSFVEALTGGMGLAAGTLLTPAAQMPTTITPPDGPGAGRTGQADGQDHGLAACEEDGGRAGRRSGDGQRHRPGRQDHRSGHSQCRRDKACSSAGTPNAKDRVSEPDALG